MTRLGKQSQDLRKDGDAYERARIGHDKIIRNLIRLRQAQPGETLRSLDIGSGMGLFLISLNRHGFDACGVEPQDAHIVRSIENCKHMGFTPDVRQGSAEAIPFPDASFDVVVSNSILEHVMDWELSLAECVRVLKPGGVMYLASTNRQHPRQMEVKNFPFFSWLPHRLQRRYVDYCLRKRPDKLDYSPFPVRFFFTHRQLMKKLRELGTTALDRYDTFNPDWFKGWRAPLRPLSRLFSLGPVKFILYFFMSITKIFAVKGEASAPAPDRKPEAPVRP